VYSTQDTLLIGSFPYLGKKISNVEQKSDKKYTVTDQASKYPIPEFYIPQNISNYLHE
jgi:hypothetical protein